MELVIIVDSFEKIAHVSTEWLKFRRKAEAAGWKLKREYKGEDGKPRRWTYEVPLSLISIRFKNPAAPKRAYKGHGFKKKASTPSPTSP